jgi:hypothetical protein
MLIIKKSGDLMKLSKKFTPQINDLLVLHPLKFNKVKKLPFGPFENNNYQSLVVID